ncbi:MAG: hypothetical protein ACR2OZ_11650 [Verrucomicrobiales bacterium]
MNFSLTRTHILRDNATKFGGYLQGGGSQAVVVDTRYNGDGYLGYQWFCLSQGVALIMSIREQLKQVLNEAHADRVKIVPRSAVNWFISTAPEECIQALQAWERSGCITVLGDLTIGTPVDPIIQLHNFIEDIRATS